VAAQEPLPDYVSVRQAHERYGISPTQIRHLVKTGKIAGKKIAHDWLIVPSSLEAYLANRPKPGRKPGYCKAQLPE